MAFSSQFAKNEAWQILIAWIVLTFGLGFVPIVNLLSGSHVGTSISALAAVGVACATGFVFHEMGHKFVAIKYGYQAHFRIWTWGLMITIVSAVVTGGAWLFGAPGAVYIIPTAMTGSYGFGYYSSQYKVRDPDRESMWISIAGPGLNLAFAAAFFVVYLFAADPFTYYLGLYGFELNIGLGAFNMIPFPPLDGSKIFKKSIGLGLAIAVPLWLILVYLLVG